ncbi:MAG: energy transducer TonB [Alistipes sp.]|nr:energy transducer TonB [Alistipes sp.]
MSDNRKTYIPNRPTARGGVAHRRLSIDLGDTRSESFGEWLFNHRIGLIAMVAAYIIGIIVVATTRINVELQPEEYIIEFVEEEPTEEELEQLRRKRDALQEEINQRLARAQRVQNLQSNDASESSASADMRYDSETEQMMDKIASDMATNRGDYESGMRQIEGMGKGSGTGSGSGGAKGTGAKGKFSGAVTVNYSFTDPVRHHRDLYVPAYRAKGGGVVVVDVWLDRNGTVTNARIASSTNPELNNQALAAAKHSRTLFRIDNTAPQSHRGTITYTFVAQ